MKTRHWIGNYLLNVLAFSGIYWCVWNVNPDSFIVNPHLNLQPFQNIQQFLWEDEPKYELGSAIDLQKYKNKYDQFYLKIGKAEQGIVDIENEYKNLELQFNKNKEQRDIDVENNFHDFERNNLEKYKSREQKLIQELGALERSKPKIISTEEDLAHIRAIGEKRVELAGARVDIATQKLRNSEYLLANVTAFFSQEVRDNFIRISERRKELYEKRFEFEKGRGDIRVMAIDALEKDLSHIKSRVKFSDFVFFSVGISTTTTFGDLVANSTLIKALISIQLLMCLVIVGGFLSSLQKQS